MKLTKKMRRRLKSLTRRQTLAFIFLGTYGDISNDSEGRPLAQLSRRDLAEIIKSWGYTGRPDDFYRKLRQAKLAARSEDAEFERFYKQHTVEQPAEGQAAGS